MSAGLQTVRTCADDGRFRRLPDADDAGDGCRLLMNEENLA